MYLSPPDAHCLGPIKMELSEPQANLQAALQVLELHHSKLNTTKVRIPLESTMAAVVVRFCFWSVLMEWFGSSFVPLIKYKPFLWLYSSLYIIGISSLSISAPDTEIILLYDILPVIVLMLCSGTSWQHHIQYPKGLYFPERDLLFALVLSLCIIKSWMMRSRIGLL